MNMTSQQDDCNEKTCPWRRSHGFAGKLRHLIQNPVAILSPYITEGMTVLDIGCGMGFLSVPAARMVGESGKVVMVDLQHKMLAGAMKELAAAGLSARAFPVQCTQQSLAISAFDGKVDFACAFMVVHEATDKSLMLAEIYRSLKPGGRLLIAEPIIHVSPENYAETLSLAQQIGFQIAGEAPAIRICMANILHKPLATKS